MPSRNEIFELVKAASPTGITSSEVAKQLGGTSANIAARMGDLQREGRVKNLNPGGPGKPGLYIAAEPSGKPAPKAKKAVLMQIRKRQRKGDLQTLGERIREINTMLRTHRFDVPINLRVEEENGVPQIKATVEI